MPNTAANREVSLTRVYTFSAAHRLESPFLTDKENSRLFGKCGRTSGHGHNYTLKVTVRGPVSQETGMVMDISEMDRIVHSRAIDPLDGRNLNMELDNLPVLTSEMLTKELWRRLDPHFKKPRLLRIEIEETRKNVFAYPA